ncbi:MAG: Radical domain protein [Candidatus Krumholzibacteriota bacterium]|nr:Radical domain protein [Candidatus Krumholzibacteriota bacterium]
MNNISHPEFIQIETNVACNAACPFCPQKTMTRKPHRMADEVWKKIIDDTRGLGITYRPFMINEPLSDKRMGAIMRYIREDGTARIELNSNGELMTEDMAREILDAGIDAIRFSIDGFSEESFSQSRVGVDYQTTVERVLKFIQLSKKRGGAKRIEVRMIDMEVNKGEQEAYKRFWASAGAVPIITSFYRWPWEPGVERVNFPCLKTLREMFIYVNGKATLCCWDAHERAVIGDVTKEHVLDVWNGAVNQRYRALLAEGRRDQILLCSRCEAYKDRQFDGFPPPSQT